MSVRAPSLTVETIGRDWPMIASLLAGTTAMRAAGKQFLPQFPSEADASYRLRLSVSTLFPAFQRTVEILAGKPFSRLVEIDDNVSDRIREWCGNVDLAGNSLHSFASTAFGSGLAYGLGGILVDYPRADGVVTQAQEREAGVRPYFVHIPGPNILGWRSERIAGRETLTQLRLLESVLEPDGEFGEKAVEQVRVLYPGRWEVWRDAATSGEWRMVDEGLTTIQRIPFVPIRFRPPHEIGASLMAGSPPLAELAHMNVEHWQSASDQQTILHVARVPILFFRNLGATQISVGASSAIMAEGPDTDGKFIEHSGAAIEAGRVSLLDLEDRMRQVGAELLVIKPGRTTVAQTFADNEPATCALQRMVRDFEATINAALGLMAEWVGEEPSGGVDIFDDFGVSNMAEATLELLTGMATAGLLSAETLFNEARRRGAIMQGLRWEDERGRIKPAAGSDTNA